MATTESELARMENDIWEAEENARFALTTYKVEGGARALQRAIEASRISRGLKKRHQALLTLRELEDARDDACAIASDRYAAAFDRPKESPEYKRYVAAKIAANNACRAVDLHRMFYHKHLPPI